MPRRWLPLLLCCTAALALPFSAKEEVDSEDSRRVLGSSVVTSVSVIMDLGNGTKKYFADAAGRPVPKPTAAAMVGSPAGLLNPDRYEFYTFDEAGDLVKRLMTLEEIQGIIANGETELGEAGLPNYYHQNLPPDSAELALAASSTVTDKVMEEAEATDIGELSSAVPGVHDVVVSVQNVLKGELEASKNKIPLPKPVPSPPTQTTIASLNSTSSWDMILSGIMNNSVSVSNVANQSTYSPIGPTPNISQELSDTSTETPSRVTQNITLTTIQELNNSAEASISKKPLSPVPSHIEDVEQIANNSVSTHSNLTFLHSSATASHISSLSPPSSSVPSSPVLSSLTPPPPPSTSSSIHLFSSTSASQFMLSSSSPKPSSLLPLMSHSSVTPSSTILKIPSILTSLTESSEIPLSLQSSLSPSSLMSEPLSTPAPKPQSSPSNGSYIIMVETITNPSLIMKDPLNVNENKPSDSYESYSKPAIGDIQVTFAETSATTPKPIGTTHLPLLTFKIPSSASSAAELEWPDTSTMSSETQPPPSSSDRPSSKIPINNQKITSSQQVSGISTTIILQNQSLAAERTTNNPSTFATSTASSSSSDSIKLPYENSESLQLPSAESLNHTDISAAQEFFHLFNLAENASSMTEHIQSKKPTHRPYTASEHSTVFKSRPSTPVPETTVVFTRTPATTTTSIQSRKPTKPLQTTPTATDITKIVTQTPYGNNNSAQTSTVNPLGVTKLSSTAINDKNDDVSTTELLRTNVLSTKPKTTIATELPLPSTTWKNNAENLLINEASGFVPMKIKSPIGVVPLPTTANGNLDMPPELAESVLGVLSQVADIEGTATTIDYGESGLYIFGSSATTTQHSITKDVSSTESNNHSSPVSTPDDSNLQSSVTSVDDNNRTTESKNTAYSTSTTDTLPETTVHDEINQPNTVPEQLFSETPSSQPLGSLYLKESTNDDQTTLLFSLENSSNIYEQDTIESTTMETGGEHKKNDPVDLNKMELKKNNGNGDDKNSEGPNKLTEAMIELEDPKMVNKEITKENVGDSTSVELLMNANNNNNEALKTNFEILEKEPYDEEPAISVLRETDPNFAINVVITTEAADDVATENGRIEQGESTISSVPELTTEQPNANAYRTSIKSEANVTSASKLGVEETSTEAVGQYVTATTVIPESIISRDTMQSLIETTKENAETSTVTLTKYKKDDAEMEEESMEGNLTLKPNDESKDEKISTEHISVVKKNEVDDDMQRVSTESQENTTKLKSETTEDETQKEELNMSTSATVDTEFVQSMETRTDINIIDNIDENKRISETKTDINFAENNESTTDLPAEDKSEEAIAYETLSFEMTTEGFTTELTARYETEITTVEDRFTSDSEESPSFRDDEPKGTTDPSVTEYEVSIETTVSPESKIENGFTKTSLEKGSEISVKDVNRWESNVNSSTGSSEKVTESGVTKKTAANTSWTKLPSLSPSQANDNKVIDRTAASSTRRPVTVISVTSTKEDSTPPIEILKFSGLNKEKVKDTKIKAKPQQPQRPQTYVTVDLEPAPQENLGLEATSAGLEEDVRRFAELCNELAFRLWASVTAKGLTPSRSVTMSPFAVTSLLAMVFLGARGPTSGQMNDILRLDDMVTFNPHQVFRNVTESVVLSRTQGVAAAAFVRELYSDRTKGKLLDFYKERAQQFYDGHVEEVNFSAIGDLVRRRTNLLIKRQTHGKVPEYLRSSNILLRPPLAVFSANIFQTDCRLASTDGRDGEMYFTVMPAIRQRRLVPVPAVVWFSGFLAGYEPVLDATAASVINENSVVSLIMVLPGQQGQQAPGDGLQRLEQRLIETSYRRGAWSRLLRSLLPRPGLELQIPRFSHRSLLNVTSPLQRMGLKDLFSSEHADLRGINGFTNDLHLSDIIQVNTFSTCAEDTIGSRHHVEVYPTSPQRSGREDLDENPKEESVNFDDVDDLGLSSLPLALRPRQARLPDAPRLRFDRPFLYFVRHNPTGLILHMGRFNPRLLH